jgi:Poly-gamma-glutamate hydrolase
MILVLLLSILSNKATQTPTRAIQDGPPSFALAKGGRERLGTTAETEGTAGFPASLWLCKGDGDEAKGASDRWHITSDDINPACFPLLQQLMSRRFCCGLAFHGFQRKEGEADVYIGGAAPRSLKIAIERALNNLDRPIKVKISTTDDEAKFQGFSPKNIINRLATRGIHLEQSFEARKQFYGEIARVIGQVFASRRRLLLCKFIKDLEEKRAKEEHDLAQSLSKDLVAGSIDVEDAIEKHKAWREKDEALAVKSKASDELWTFIEEHIDELKT